jgi:hypothetical protein
LKIEKKIKQETSSDSTELEACTCWLLFEFLFDPEDGSVMILRKVELSTNYTALQPT